jgi:hypothetical protein
LKNRTAVIDSGYRSTWIVGDSPSVFPGDTPTLLPPQLLTYYDSQYKRGLGEMDLLAESISYYRTCDKW